MIRIGPSKRCFYFASTGRIVRSIGMPRLSYSKRIAIRQAVEMQGICFSCAKLLDEDLRSTEDKELRARLAAALGGLGRNWTALQDSVRVLKGDPLPGSLKPIKKLTKSKSCCEPLSDPDDGLNAIVTQPQSE